MFSHHKILILKTGTRPKANWPNTQISTWLADRVWRVFHRTRITKAIISSHRRFHSKTWCKWSKASACREEINSAKVKLNKRNMMKWIISKYKWTQSKSIPRAISLNKVHTFNKINKTIKSYLTMGRDK